METSFTGWPAEALAFFQGLRQDNTKDYFEAHREIYQRAVRAPMLALVESLADELGEPKIFRINRDLRFSRDKTPYQTHVSAAFGMGALVGLYVQCSDEGLFLAAGAYAPSPEQLGRIRDAVADEEGGPALAAIVAEAEGRGYQVGDETLKRVPAGYPKDHPRARLLRFTRLVLSRGFPPAPWLHTPEVRERVLGLWADIQPLQAWLAEYVEP